MDTKTSLVALAVAVLVAASVAASFGIAAQAQNAIVYPGDPQRWYLPAETLVQKYSLAMKEAGAALKEALRECRGTRPADRKACEAEARAQWKHDTQRARGFLSGDNAALARR